MRYQAANPAVKRTRNGRPRLALISFWAKHVPPLRAASANVSRMKRYATHQPILATTAAGVIVKIGSTSEFSVTETTPYVVLKSNAIELATLFSVHGLDVTKSPTLSLLIDDTMTLSDNLLCNRGQEMSYAQVFSALQLRRIAEAVLLDTSMPDLRRLLTELLDGSLDLLSRDQSKAKDTLWELELLRVLTENGVAAKVGEPDLIATVAGPSIGIACKKLYSDKNFSKVLSQAIGQIEKTFEYGIVAINIDDMLPPNSILKAPDIERMLTLLAEIVHEFMAKHERHLRHYLAP